MRKFKVILALLAVGMMVSVSNAGIGGDVIDGVQLISTSGVSASYDNATGITSWSQGASGWLMTNGYQAAAFTSVSITGTFYGAVDTTSDGHPSAIFNSGTWSMHLENGSLNVDVAGHTLGNYVETEGKLQEGHIDGRAIVIVDSATFSFGDYGWGEVQLHWEGDTGNQAGLIADIALPQGSTFSNYATDSYESTNTTISLWADEGTVPEPATLILLGLGGLLLRKRKKA